MIFILLPRISTSNLCSASPTTFEALIVYFPEWATGLNLGITRLLDEVFWSISNLTLSFNVNSLSFNNQETFAFGKASIKHSNLIDWSWTTIVFLGKVINFGAPLSLSN